ncbi:MAG: DUF1800 domain-containing protein [Sulfitobacter sp.]
MSFTPEFAERRFGYGLSPHVAAPLSSAAMLAGLSAPDVMAQRFPIEGFDAFRARMIEATELRKKRRKAGGTPAEEKLRKREKRLQARARKAKIEWFFATLNRRIHGTQNFRERLVYFWADHFTALGKGGVLRRATSPYVEDAIRPHIAGNFADLLKSAVTHPLMVHYLDQNRSVGPDSKRAIKANGTMGLNENLAREVLELHTLGVNGPYRQEDVQQLAKLLTGLTYSAQDGAKFRKDFAQPGAEKVLGKSYGPKPGMQPIHRVLEDLALHPATARHVAQKLAVHFVADTPDPALVTHLEKTYLFHEGALLPVYEALLDHPATWAAPAANMRHPVEFVSAALRALAPPDASFAALEERDVNGMFFTPMMRMGQLWQQPNGPDGWAEADADWITPQGIAARLDWAMRVPVKLLPDLPDPRIFVTDALGSAPPASASFAASAAESRAEAIGLVLMSPAFQRR